MGEMVNLMVYFSHVNDSLHGSGRKEFEINILQPLRQRFLFGKEEESSFRYILVYRLT